MSSGLMESMGLGGLDIAYVLIGMLVFILVLLVLIIIQFSKVSKLQEKIGQIYERQGSKES